MLYFGASRYKCIIRRALPRHIVCGPRNDVYFSRLDEEMLRLRALCIVAYVIGGGKPAKSLCDEAIARCRYAQQ